MRILDVAMRNVVPRTFHEAGSCSDFTIDLARLKTLTRRLCVGDGGAGGWKSDHRRRFHSGE